MMKADQKVNSKAVTANIKKVIRSPHKKASRLTLSVKQSPKTSGILWDIMSVMTVQLGQCGNQIGGELFDTVADDFSTTQGFCSKKENESYQACCQERFFREERCGLPVARAVLIDMEPKVISQTLLKTVKSGKWKYGEKSYFCQKQGSGNNWADGFCAHGPRHTDALMDMMQREVEKCEYLGGIFTLMSMAGGTGSGLGTYVTQCLRDAYPKSFFLNEVIWPYDTGEVIVQNYNSVLTLSHLYQSADALLVHENDTVHKICSQLMGLKHISFRDVNQVIAHQLGSVLQPAYTSAGATEYGRNPLGNLLESLSPHPEYKLISIFNIPQMGEASLAYSAFTWPGLLKHLRQMLISSTKMEEGINWQVRPPPAGLPSEEKVSPNKQLHFNTSLANLIILRGKNASVADIAGFKDSALYTSWIPAHIALNVWRTCRPFNKYEKSATLVSNSQCLLKPLDSAVRKAWNMFASKAYVHQYAKHGITEDDFLDSFAMLEQVISSYSNL